MRDVITFSSTDPIAGKEYVLPNSEVVVVEMKPTGTALTELVLQVRYTGEKTTEFPWQNYLGGDDWADATNPIIYDVTTQKPNTCPANSVSAFRINTHGIYSVRLLATPAAATGSLVCSFR